MYKCPNCKEEMIYITDPDHFFICKNCEKYYDTNFKEISNPLIEKDFGEEASSTDKNKNVLY